MQTVYEEESKSVDKKTEDTPGNSGAGVSLPPVTSGTPSVKTPNAPPDNVQSTNQKNNSKNDVGEVSSMKENQSNYDGSLAPLKSSDVNDDNRKNNSSQRPLASSTAPDTTSHSRAKAGESRTVSSTVYPSSFPSGRRRGNMQQTANSHWRLPVRKRSIGHGTVGLYQGVSHDADVPNGARACVNGTLIVGPATHVRKVQDYIQWREKHSDLFSTMRQQDEKERVESRRRRLIEAERQRELKEGEYAAAITRLRHRGWSVLGDTPRPVDHERRMQIQAQREAVRAECEGVTVRKLLEATKLRENIAHDLALRKETRQQEQKLVRDAARVEREHWHAFREQREAQLRKRAETARAERDAAREYNRACLTVDAASWRQYVAAARDRVQTRSTTPDASAKPKDWRRTFRSPLRMLPNAGDGAVRRAWAAEFLDVRRAVAAAAVARVRGGRAAAAADGGVGGAAFREKCARAEALRAERAELRARAEALRAERWEAAEALRQARTSPHRGRQSPEMEDLTPES
ncbi:hypothetical protein LSM04_006942 [Trypanosoma melophagium]|uniref:uncharacterized protein n=1 Tax=Trypanosoma melophagium TaxID=715481 RepID=UPI00351A5E99|nr:hypothetical protein LSM04_006942 [Trypanosoma melophagium]